MSWLTSFSLLMLKQNVFAMPNVTKGSIPSKEKSHFITLTGNYKKESDTIFLKDSKVLKINFRKEISLSKPKYFLTLQSKGKKTFVSSLYPTREKGIFNGDYLGIKYSFDFKNEGFVKIQTRVVSNNSLV